MTNKEIQEVYLYATKAIGKQIKEERKIKKWTIERLAAKCDITSRSIINMENGRACNMLTYLIVLDKLGLSITLPIVKTT
jgi:DNA-binding XRE family transcriptional regulator